MRARIEPTRRLFTRITLAAAMSLVLVSAVVPFVSNARANTSGETTISALTVEELSSGMWRVSGTATPSDGDYLGLSITLEGSILEDSTSCDANGFFSLDAAMDPQSSDWIDARAEDASGIRSDWVTHYFE